MLMDENINSLPDMVEFLSAELKKESIQCLQLKDRLQKQADAHLQQFMIWKQSLQEANSCHLEDKEGSTATNLEPKAEEDLWREMTKLSIRMETVAEHIRSLAEKKQDNSAKLQKQRTQIPELKHQQQKENIAHQEDLQAVKCSNIDRNAQQLLELESLKATNLEFVTELKAEKELSQNLKSKMIKLSTMLEAETEKNKSLTKEKENLSAELQMEWAQTKELKFQLQKQNNALQEELQAVKQSNKERNALKLQELESLKFTTLELVNKLKMKDKINQDLQRQSVKLYISLEAETEKNKSLTKEREDLSAKLQM
ncbi:uncharacterized protein [Paralichthys olivaceus]|uniref:uncharacterized protein n=1 Tax=Paralichthys olivaceus TaxID=8255 RepID=UPI0037528259